MPMRPIQVRFSKPFLDRLRERADRDDITVSQWVRDAVIAQMAWVEAYEEHDEVGRILRELKQLGDEID